jgi:hypothetical protein
VFRHWSSSIGANWASVSAGPMGYEVQNTRLRQTEREERTFAQKKEREERTLSGNSHLYTLPKLEAAYILFLQHIYFTSLRLSPSTS